MRFARTPIAGAFVVDFSSSNEERDALARAFCAREFRRQGLEPAVAQINFARNHDKGSLRGMHWQDESAIQPKLVRCVRGAIWDVIIDLRPNSVTLGVHVAVELSADNEKALYVPGLCAHGYQTLTPDAEVLYLMGGFHTPSAQRGLRYDDPEFGIEWPLPVTVISARDRAWPPYELPRKGLVH